MGSPAFVLIFCQNDCLKVYLQRFFGRFDCIWGLEQIFLYGEKYSNQKTSNIMRLERYNPTAPVYSNGFNALLDSMFKEPVGKVVRKFVPAVDIFEEADHYELMLVVPGMKKTDFQVEVTEGKLHISGERKAEEKKEGRKCQLIESSFGTFSRSFQLPETVKVDDIQAVYEDGILKLTLPKDQKKNISSKIEVK